MKLLATVMMTACALLAGLTVLDEAHAQDAAQSEIGNFVWNDLNQNGQQEASEPGIAGVVIEVWTADENGIPVVGVVVATTDANGIYSSGPLDPGEYIVFVRAPGDATPTIRGTDPVSGLDSNIDADGLSGVIALGSGENDSTVDAGFIVHGPRLAELGDFVWADTNDNGRQDPLEPGIDGVVVRIWEADENGLRDQLVERLITNEAGSYLTRPIVPGDYIVEVEAPSGYTIGRLGVDPDAANDNNFGADGLSGVITLASGESNYSVDAGFVVGRPRLGDRVWPDTNRNGLQDRGERGIEGATVRIWSASEDGLPAEIVATFTTGESGLYTSGLLDPGDYIVQVEPPPLYQPTFLGTDPDSAIDNNIAASGFSSVVTLLPGETNTTIDAGYVLTPVAAELGGIAWIDRNRDGTRDPDESATNLDDIRIYTADENGLRDEFVKSVFADPFGAYTSGALEAGDYIVSLDPGPSNAFTSVGNDLASDVDNNIDAGGSSDVITLLPGETNTTIGIGLIGRSAIGDTVFEDVNRNGLLDDGEPGVPGAVITAFSVGQGISRVKIGSTTSDDRGRYLIDGLLFSAYVLVIELPAGLKLTTPNVGGNEQVDSDFSLAASEVRVGVGNNETELTVDAGVVRASQAGDANCDGVLNILDAFATSQYVVGLRTGVNGCPLTSVGTEINVEAFSNPEGAVTILDAFRVSQCVVGLPNSLCPAAE